MPEESLRLEIEFYCPRCHKAVTDPLVCGDCSAIICRICGAPLEKIDELGSKLGPEFVALADALKNMDPNSQDGKEIGSIFDKLDKLCED